MSQVQNSEILLELRKQAGLQLGKDKIPQFLSSGIVPTIELSSKIVKPAFVKNATNTATGQSTLYAIPTNQDFYLTTATYSVVKDAACDATTGRMSINATIGGASIEIVSIPYITLTASNNSISITFPHPIKIDRGTNITYTGSFTAGVCVKSAAISGFLDEVSNG